MLLRSSERTSNSKALSTISRFVFRRVSFRALLIKSSSMLMLVRAMQQSYTTFRQNGVSTLSSWNDDVARWKLPSGEFPFLQLDVDYTDTLLKAWMEQQKMNEPEMTETIAIAMDEMRGALAAAEGKPEDAVKNLERTAAREQALPPEFGPANLESRAMSSLANFSCNSIGPLRPARLQAALAQAPGRKLTADDLARANREIVATAAKDTAKPRAARLLTLHPPAGEVRHSRGYWGLRHRGNPFRISKKLAGSRLRTSSSDCSGVGGGGGKNPGAGRNRSRTPRLGAPHSGSRDGS